MLATKNIKKEIIHFVNVGQAGEEFTSNSNTNKQHVSLSPFWPNIKLKSKVSKLRIKESKNVLI